MAVCSSPRADGRFTAALRSLVQFDYGYFSQGKNPASVDLNSGSNFRRAQIRLGRHGLERLVLQLHL